jgi:hypothetical protein
MQVTKESSRQHHGYCTTIDKTPEALLENWERFEQLCIQYPYHQIPDQLLIQYFYKGLMPTDRNIIDVASIEGHWLIKHLRLHAN